MIINGSSRSNEKFFSRHLANGDKNERVKLVEVRGLTSLSIASCFREMKAVASGSRVKNYFYHSNINILKDEKLTPAQWEKAVDTLEKNLGLEGQPRFVIEHEKKGRTHQHVIWSRINIETMTAISDSKDFAVHQATSRQLEKEFNLERGKSVLGPEVEKPRPERRPENRDVFRGKKSGVDPQKMKEEITEIWNTTTTGKEFFKELDAHGYILARGDRAPFCIVDRAGDVHSLARRIATVRTRAIRERLADIERDLLSIPEAKELQQTRQEKGQEQGRGDFMENGFWDRDFEDIPKEEPYYNQVYGLFEQSKRLERMRQFEQHRQQAEHDPQTGERLKSFRDELDDEAKRARRDTHGHYDRDITNADYRYAEALGNHYDIKDPYGSLARAAMAEYGAFMRQRQNLERQIATEKDPHARQSLELRRDIEAAEYMEITSNRLARQSVVITGNEKSPEAQHQREQAADYHTRAQTLRIAYRKHRVSKDLSSDLSKFENRTARGNEREKTREEPHAQPTPEKIRKGTAQPLKVADLKTGKVGPLHDYVDTLLSDPKHGTKDSMAAKKNREIALDRIASGLKQGNKAIDEKYLRYLSRDDLQNIKSGGDDRLRDMARAHERSRDRSRGR